MGTEQVLRTTAKIRKLHLHRILEIAEVREWLVLVTMSRCPWIALPVDRHRHRLSFQRQIVDCLRDREMQIPRIHVAMDDSQVVNTFKRQQELPANRSAMLDRNRPPKTRNDVRTHRLEDQAVMLTVWTNVSEVIKKCDDVILRSVVGSNETIDCHFVGRF